MLEYLPWSNKVLNECLDDYCLGRFSILDIELGGQCNYHCIYCDSPSRNKSCIISIEQIEAAFVSMNIKWVFVCGLGEPTALGNLSILINILKLCEKYSAQCSIFTNLSMLNDEIKYYINRGVLNLLFKYDSSDIGKTMSLYGVPNVNKQIFNIARVKDLVRVNDGCTNLAASIVPTKVNKDEILSIVKDCLDHNIYPLIAELNCLLHSIRIEDIKKAFTSDVCYKKVQVDSVTDFNYATITDLPSLVIMQGAEVISVVSGYYEDEKKFELLELIKKAIIGR